MIQGGAGIYLIGCEIRFTANATGIRYAQVSVNGVAINLASSIGNSTYDGLVNALNVASLGVGSKISCEAYQDSGGMLALVGNALGNQSVFFAIKLW